MDPHIKVEVPESFDQGKPVLIHLLEGKAPDPINPKAISIAGNANAIEAFLSGIALAQMGGLQQQEFERYNWKNGEAFIVVNAKEMKAVLYINSRYSNSTTVEAKIKYSDHVEKFCIESGRRFTPATLLSLFRISKHYFVDEKQHQDLILALKNFSAKVEKLIEDKNDGRGNTSSVENVRLETQMPDEFTLSIPMINGYGPERVNVLIGIETTATGVQFWLESPMLLEYRDKIIGSWVDTVKKLGSSNNIAVIEQ